jgi:flavin reductase (DIM6/NTAB) family NADH-FMN oxidoreductase RutF
MASLAATPREGGVWKPGLDALRTSSASVIDGVFIEDAYLFLECMLDRIVDDFGDNSLIVGRILAAHVEEEYLRVSEKGDQDLIREPPSWRT